MTDLFHDTPLFHETEGNPRPENATGGFFITRDRKKIRYGLFAAVARPMRGTVVLLSGRNECIEKYFETIRDLAARGFGVATLDWRGQGDSDRLIRDRQRGYVRSPSATTRATSSSSSRRSCCPIAADRTTSSPIRPER